MNFLTEEHTKPYANKKPPMTELGEFVYYRTYSRYLPEQKRRETWLETITRTINYNLGLELEFIEKNRSWMDKEKVIRRLRREALELLDNMFNLRLFASGRTMWIGGTPVSKLYPTANFNCAFIVIDDFQAFCEMFYLLMVGAGVGFRTMPYDIEKLPPYRTGIKLTAKPYVPIPKEFRNENTELHIDGNKAQIIVGDSKEGWVQALDTYFKLLTSPQHETVNEIEIVYDHVRPKGERLVRFGGTASGHESLKIMFEKIHRVMESAGGKLRPIHALDIGNIIGKNVVSGGVRRTAQINLAAKDDMEIEDAKNHIFYQDENGNVVANNDLLHRTISNNTIYYEEKPTREELHQNFLNMRRTGERGIMNVQAARKRREDGEGLNPCGEAILANRGLCNLSTVNVMAFVENGKLNRPALYRAFELATRIGVRMTLVDLELPKWDEQQKKDRLIGVSMTGFFDMVDSVDMSVKEQRQLLKTLRKIVRDTANMYAKFLGINAPILATTIKPEGTISQLPTVSSGIHRSHSKYYIRRIRVSANDPMVKVAMELGYPVFPEVGQTWENADTLVVEFPVKSYGKRTKYDVTAIEQLETYKMFIECYAEHNASITVTVRPHEWDEVEQWVWDNWDSFVSVTFLPLDDAVYPLAPYEAIDEEEYHRRKAQLKPFDPSLLSKYETGEDFEIRIDGCEGGLCPVR